MQRLTVLQAPPLNFLNFQKVLPPKDLKDKLISLEFHPSLQKFLVDVLETKP